MFLLITGFLDLCFLSLLTDKQNTVCTCLWVHASEFVHLKLCVLLNAGLTVWSYSSFLLVYVNFIIRVEWSTNNHIIISVKIWLFCWRNDCLVVLQDAAFNFINVLFSIQQYLLYWVCFVTYLLTVYQNYSPDLSSLRSVSAIISIWNIVK